MATSYPSGLDNFNNPTSTSSLGDPGVVHHEQHANSNDAIEAIQAKLGADNSSVVTSIDYRVRSLEDNPEIPDQTNNAGKYLTTNGSVVSWGIVSGGGSEISSTDELPEGTNNLYFTNERAQDAIDTLFANGSHNGITVTYNDQNNSISLASTASASAATPTSEGIVFARTSSNTLSSTSIGFQSLNSLTSATAYNVGVGVNSLYSNTTGYSNVAIGKDAGYSNTTGAANIAIGTDSLKLNTVSQQNVAIGEGALGEFISTEAQGLNTTIGNEAGKGITTGRANTIIGAFAGKNYLATDLTTGSNNTLIGRGAATSSSTVSNEITLGNASISRFRVPGLGIDWTSSNIPTSLPSQSGQSGKYLTTNGSVTSWATVSSGSATPRIGQVVVSSTSSTTSSTGGAGWVDVSGLSVTITPTLSTSKILVSTSFTIIGSGSSYATGYVQLIRDSTPLQARFAGSYYPSGGGVNTAVYSPYSVQYVDSPATTSATTYKVQINNILSSNNWSANPEAVQIQIIAMEILA